MCGMFGGGPPSQRRPRRRHRQHRERQDAGTVRAGYRAIGYCVTGRAGRGGYLQRLAVARDRQRLGLGTLLVSDALTWLQRRGAREAFVNTQTGNQRALRFYTRLGFYVVPDPLTVLRRQLE